MTPDDEQPPRRAFKVEDRRRFTDSGDTKSDAPEPEPTPTTPPPISQPSAAPPPTGGAEHESHEINFSTFILSLTTQALAHLGDIPDPLSKQINVDLHAARQMIDILGMLQTKTRANLDKSEADLLEGLLYDLRLRFVERSKR